MSRLEFSGAEAVADSSGKARLTLDQIYTALLTSALEHKAEGRRREAEPTEALHRLSAVAQLNAHNRLVLLGAPGSGKSSFVNYVALCMAGELLGTQPANLATLTAPLPRDEEEAESDEPSPTPQPWTHGALLPVRIVLRNFAATHLPPAGQPANATHLLAYVQTLLASATLGDFAKPLATELREQGGLILLDGLDEVPEAEARRAQIKQVVESFTAVFPRCRFVVTSRTYAYQNEAWRLDGFQAALLEPFQPAQIRAFVTRWYARIAPLRDLTPADAAGRATLLIQAILHNDRLLPLAEQPLLLTLMANLHAFRGGSLPERRVQLYAAAVELLLDWWERQRIVYGEDQQYRVVQPSLLEYLQIGKERMVAALGELAFQAHARNPEPSQPAVIRQAELVDALLTASPDANARPSQLLEYLSHRTGLLLPEGNRVFKFPHRTFQEYLAALQLTGPNHYPDTVADLARRDPNRWREVLLLAGAHAASGTESPAWELAEALCPTALVANAVGMENAWGVHLAGQVLHENVDVTQVRARHQAKLDRIRQGLVYVLEKSQLPALERALAGRTLAHLGDPRPEVMTLAGMQFCYVPPGPFLASQGDQVTELADGYWISRYPVTNAQFQPFVAAGGYIEARFGAEAQQGQYWSKQGFKDWRDEQIRTAPDDFGKPFNLSNHPVVGVSWYEAVAFCRWLREQGQQTGWEVRLPTDAEWTKAARGGLLLPGQALLVDWASQRWVTDTVGQQRNPKPKRRSPSGGRVGAEVANYAKTNINTTSAVGCFPRGRSPYGVEELSGNVWEWLWQERGDLAGGAYYSEVGDIISSARGRDDPYDRYDDFGFRCVVVPFSR